MAGREKQRHVDLSDGIRLVLTDHGLDYGNRFTAEAYAADGKCCGSLGNGTDSDEEHLAAEYDLCILRALSASAGKRCLNPCGKRRSRSPHLVIQFGDTT